MSRPVNSTLPGEEPRGHLGDSSGTGRLANAAAAPGAPLAAIEQEVAIVAGAGPGAAEGAPVPPLGRLELALREGSRRGPAPVDRWQPPYCGDVGLAIAGDGTWTYRGSPIRRQPLVKLFASVLRRDADGRHYLVTPVEKVDVAVEDAPFLAVEMEVLGEGPDRVIVLRTNVDDVVRVGPENPLRFAVEAGTGGVKPYVLVRGRLEALATRPVTYELLALVEEARRGDAVDLAIRSGGCDFPLPA